VRAVLELPIDNVVSEIAAMYHATRHWKPIVNGYSGYLPEPYLEIRDRCFPVPDDRALQLLRSWGVTHVLFHPQALEQRWERRTLRSWQDSGEVETVYDDGVDRVYRLLPPTLHTLPGDRPREPN